ncbi:hypothetical protein KRX54_00835 [Actinomycetaceae bacterium TAE3-ERU4]|nr:hypothetical protein [Actinomycetaceae bacterium TAE3-ERU4]
MALFEFDNGRFFPAQFGRPVAEGITEQVFDSIRRQVLDILNRPFFPVIWVGEGVKTRLIALDASGQVVSIQVIHSLNSETMVSALAALNDVRALGWNELAELYPGGQAAFRTRLSEFRAQMPANASPGPRLIVVAAEVKAGLRPAIEVLATSGMEVNEVSLREMSNGRRFIEVTPVSQSYTGSLHNWLGSRNPQIIPTISEGEDESSTIPSSLLAAARINTSTPITVQADPALEAEPQAEPQPQAEAKIEIELDTETERVSADTKEASPEEDIWSEPLVETSSIKHPALISRLRRRRNTVSAKEELLTFTPGEATESENTEVLKPVTVDELPAPAAPKIPAGIPRRVGRRLSSQANAAFTSKTTRQPVSHQESTTAPHQTQAEMIEPSSSGTVPRRSRLSRRTHQGHTQVVKKVERDEQGLAQIASSLGEPVTLFALVSGAPESVELHLDGTLRGEAGAVSVTPALALLALGEEVSGDAWDRWHIHDLNGPTLADAQIELNSGHRATSATDDSSPQPIAAEEPPAQTTPHGIPIPHRRRTRRQG